MARRGIISRLPAAGRGVRVPAHATQFLLVLAAAAWLAGSSRAARKPRGQQGSGQSQGPSQRQEMELTPAARQAIGEIYQGHPSAALAAALEMEKAQPDQPLGFLIEAEARWWQMYCQQSEVEYGMVNLWSLPKGAGGPADLAAAQRAARLGEQEIQHGDTAQAELWAGMGYALESRVYAAQGAKLATARAGVKARAHLLRAIALDPRLADADTGLGLYNYYVDTLSPVVKLLRIFLGIPGGDKRQGIEQLRTAMQRAQMTAVEARFYLAKNLRTYDRDYSQALRAAEPLAREYPQNPVFLLLIGNLQMELGRRSEAAATLARIGRLNIPDAACAERSRQLSLELRGGN
jgi:hypothetical protein